MPVLPVHISFMNWASQIQRDLPNINVPIIESEEKWRDWASQLIHGNNLTNVPQPTHMSFPGPEDWRKWAAFFINGAYNFNPSTT